MPQDAATQDAISSTQSDIVYVRNEISSAVMDVRAAVRHGQHLFAANRTRRLVELARLEIACRAYISDPSTENWDEMIRSWAFRNPIVAVPFTFEPRS